VRTAQGAAMQLPASNIMHAAHASAQRPLIPSHGTGPLPSVPSDQVFYHDSSVPPTPFRQQPPLGIDGFLSGPSSSWDCNHGLGVGPSQHQPWNGMGPSPLPPWNGPPGGGGGGGGGGHGF
jgi:hypothetical protein